MARAGVDDPKIPRGPPRPSTRRFSPNPRRHARGASAEQLRFRRASNRIAAYALPATLARPIQLARSAQGHRAGPSDFTRLHQHASRLARRSAADAATGWRTADRRGYLSWGAGLFRAVAFRLFEFRLATAGLRRDASGGPRRIFLHFRHSKSRFPFQAPQSDRPAGAQGVSRRRATRGFRLLPVPRTAAGRRRDLGTVARAGKIRRDRPRERDKLCVSRGADPRTGRVRSIHQPLCDGDGCDDWWRGAVGLGVRRRVRPRHADGLPYQRLQHDGSETHHPRHWSAHGTDLESLQVQEAAHCPCERPGGGAAWKTLGPAL